MRSSYSRRDFLRGLLALSASGLLAGACGRGVSPASQATPVEPFVLPTSQTPSSVPPRVVPTAGAVPPTTTATPPSVALPPETVTPSLVDAVSPPDLAVARGPGADPAELVRRTVQAIGGMERFVRHGADVIVKPNIGSSYHGPEYAATTNPQVVAALVALCLAAGAKRVRVMDYPFGGSPQACYTNSGIAAAVTAAGGQMEVMNRLRFREVAFPAARSFKKWKVYGDILDADLVINVPIAKHHGGTRLTLGMKNLMGVIEDRGGFHSRGLHQCIADLNTVVKPKLTVIDAVRILVDNGPTGGSLDDVRRMDTVIVGTDVVAADAYAATLFGLKGTDIGHIRLAGEMGLGRADLDGLRIEEITVS